jgi:hypothetical protein
MDNFVDEGGVCEKWSEYCCWKFPNPLDVLEKLVVSGYCFHGSSRKIDGYVEPQQGCDFVKQSGNEMAVYMTINPLVALFTAIFGGVSEISERRHRCFLKIDKEVVSYPGKPYFAVNDPSMGVDEGYVYVFDRKNEGFEKINGEILSKNKVKPLFVVKIKMDDFEYEVDRLVS